MIDWNRKIECKDGKALVLIHTDNSNGTDYFVVNRGTCEYSVFSDGKPADPELAKLDALHVRNA